MPSATDNPVDRVRKFRAKTIEHGGAAISVMLKPGDEAVMWKRLVLDQGGPTPALRYLLRLAMERADAPLSNAELVNLVAARLREPDPLPATVRPKPEKPAKTPKKSS